MARKRRSEAGDRRRRREAPARPTAGASRRSGPAWRLFVALDPPDEVRRALAGWRDAALEGREDLRPVAAAALHVTLCFLGWRPEQQATRIADAVAAACKGRAPAALAPAGVVPVPSRRPRLFALDLEDRNGAATAVHAATGEALAAIGAYEPEARPFWPHLTLVRVKRGARAAPPDPPPLPAPFEAHQVTLYRSILRPQGALYEPLAAVQLGRS